MNPSADVLALASIRQDVSAVEPGMQLTVLWQGKPVFIRHRTGAEIADAQAQDAEAASFIDGLAREAEGAWIVQMGVCTHLGCVPLGDGAGDFGGWFCPCHGSHYDLAGRIRKGPAPENLPVPPARWVDATTIELG
ncbi:UNVERIFIED_CONTAM: hypothetical protein GTU68_057780 [Idotea baltica]|nr:hypothetical protein [Idotea baltica]